MSPDEPSATVAATAAVLRPPRETNPHQDGATVLAASCVGASSSMRLPIHTTSTSSTFQRTSRGKTFRRIVPLHRDHSHPLDG
eukprot:5368296-Prymnesium_polylepis.2